MVRPQRILIASIRLFLLGRCVCAFRSSPGGGGGGARPTTNRRTVAAAGPRGPSLLAGAVGEEEGRGGARPQGGGDGDAGRAAVPPRVGDRLRASTGIRPSLHPVTINAVAAVLKIRAEAELDSADNGDGYEQETSPVERAVAAGRVAADALATRQSTSLRDGMGLDPDEQRTVAGRVVGVAMRLPILEAELRGRCASAPWIRKYGAWDSFGVTMPDGTGGDDDDRRRIVADPLFRLTRAECLLALFLDRVEKPELAAKNETVPDASVVDFLDEDRGQVLLGSTSA